MPNDDVAISAEGLSQRRLCQKIAMSLQVGLCRRRCLAPRASHCLSHVETVAVLSCGLIYLCLQPCLL